MAPRKNTGGGWQALRKVALQYPEAEEGLACKGTALECPTVHARNKTFLFLGSQELKLKLHDSLAEATQLAAKEPQRYQVGTSGWVAVKFSPDESPPPGVFERWIEESYRLIAPKKLVAMLPEHGSEQLSSTKAASQKTVTKKVQKKSAPKAAKKSK